MGQISDESNEYRKSQKIIAYYWFCFYYILSYIYINKSIGIIRFPRFVLCVKIIKLFVEYNLIKTSNWKNDEYIRCTSLWIRLVINELYTTEQPKSIRRKSNFLYYTVSRSLDTTDRTPLLWTYNILFIYFLVKGHCMEKRYDIIYGRR